MVAGSYVYITKPHFRGIVEFGALDLKKTYHYHYHSNFGSIQTLAAIKRQHNSYSADV